jgi:hypothetical protein
MQRKANVLRHGMHVSSQGLEHKLAIAGAKMLAHQQLPPIKAAFGLIASRSAGWRHSWGATFLRGLAR